MAKRPSLTVSIAALIIGILMVIVRVMRVEVETSRGSTDEAAGIINTSSKVRPSITNFSTKAFRSAITRASWSGMYVEDMTATHPPSIKTSSTRCVVNWTSHRGYTMIACPSLFIIGGVYFQLYSPYCNTRKEDESNLMLTSKTFG